jgi:hypothetical protein
MGSVEKITALRRYMRNMITFLTGDRTLAKKRPDRYMKPHYFYTTRGCCDVDHDNERATVYAVAVGNHFVDKDMPR